LNQVNSQSHQEP